MYLIMTITSRKHTCRPATPYRKDLAINMKIDNLRLAATSALLSGRKDVVVVLPCPTSTVWEPVSFYNNVIEIKANCWTEMYFYAVYWTAVMCVTI